MLNSLLDYKETSTGTRVLQERIYKEDGTVDWMATDIARADSPIFIDHEKDMVSFKMMTSPASQGGSGAQLTDLVEVALHQLKFFNAKFPCPENELTIAYWTSGLNAQKKRTEDRVKRNVEGKDLK